MRSDSDLHEPRTNTEQSETGGDLRVSYESDDLYFVRVKDGPVKIGRSNNVPARLRSMQTGCPFDLECILVMPGQGFQEKLWHEALDDDRCRGEWFDYNSSEVRNTIGLAKQGKDWWEAIWPRRCRCSRCCDARQPQGRWPSIRDGASMTTKDTPMSAERDIVERLRDFVVHPTLSLAFCEEAAAEIERLREALAQSPEDAEWLRGLVVRGNLYGDELDRLRAIANRLSGVRG